jgi:aldose 1-epimerase
MKRDSHLDLAAPPRIFNLTDGQGLQLAVMDVGATWLSCRTPVAQGMPREILLGHAEPSDHLHQPGYLGAIVGRYANRIAQARFELGGRTHQLRTNEGPHQLHGGPEGFNCRRWQVLHSSEQHVRFALDSPSGDQGFPGALHAEVEYRIEVASQVSITFDTEVDAACPVNLTSHAYFNLDAQHRDARAHRIRIASDHFLPVSNDLIPTGELLAVQGTVFDLRNAPTIGEQLRNDPQQRLAGGYDHCYVLQPICANGTTPAAEAWSSDGQLGMTLSTSYPGLQFYSGNRLAQTLGRDRHAYAAHAGFALEPQYFPDSPNRPDWPQPDCVQQPGEQRRHVIRLCFHHKASSRSL